MEALCDHISLFSEMCKDSVVACCFSCAGFLVQVKLALYFLQLVKSFSAPSCFKLLSEAEQELPEARP